MDRVIHIADRFFKAIFTSSDFGFRPILSIATRIMQNPYLLFGAIFIIIGFSVSMIKRIIYS